jgi:hypothetical protein
MSLAMQEGRDFGWSGNAGAPARMRVMQPDAYEPDLSAYIVDPRNDRRAALKRDLAEGRVKGVDISLGCIDGRREHFALAESDAKAYFELDFDARHAFFNRKITERRLTKAVSAYRKFSESGSPFAGAVTPDEEACLREFDGIVVRTSLREGERKIREGAAPNTIEILRPGFMRLAEAALPHISTGATQERLNEALREDGFWDGSGESADGAYRPWADREYLARGGPAYRQQLIADVWDAQAKNYYAWSHDPVVRTGCAILTEFPLGRGVRIVCKDPALQNFVDGVWRRCKLDDNLRIYTNTLSRDGELFIRKIRDGAGAIDFNALDPQTIWEVITSGENVGQVYYYLQRYPTRYQMDSAGVPDAQVRYIDRTLGASEVNHVKINADAHDVRGRSDIFPALGWAKRLRDYADAEVQKSQAHAAYQWAIKVAGGSADISRIAGLIPSGRPQPGATFVMNDKVDVSGVNSGANAGTSGNGSTYELLLNQIALAFGIPKDYFGVSSRGSRATALVAADPASKKFEDRQNIIKSQIVEPLIAAAIDEARSKGLLSDVKDWSWRATFPAIIKADAQVRAQLLEDARANGAISHKTYAEEMVGELDLDDYDFDEEDEQIVAEIGVHGWELTSKNGESVKRGLPDKSDVAFDPAEVPNPAFAAGGDDGGDRPEPQVDAGAAPPTSATGAGKIRNEVGAHESRRRSLDAMRVQEAARIIHAAGGLVVLA